MKRILLLVFFSVAFLCMIVAGAGAQCHRLDANSGAKWALHYAGAHNAKTNTCDYKVTDCLPAAGQVVVNAPLGPGRSDIYVLALDTRKMAGTRYGICADPVHEFYFYGWTTCSHLEIATPGWPGGNEGNAQVWTVEQPHGHVTLGILDVYVYGGANYLMTCDDPRVGFGEWCNQNMPVPKCCRRFQSEYPQLYGYVGFGVTGYNPCDMVSVERTSWGAVKSIYR